MNVRFSLTRGGAALALACTAHAAVAAPDWSKVPKRDIVVFSPGVTPMEWIMKKSDHSGRTGINKGESCVGCHEEKGGLNLDLKRMAGKEVEPVGAPKTLSFPVTMQAAYDKEHLYLRLSFKAPKDAAAGADREEKSPKHEVKAAVMFVGAKVPLAAQAGCWVSCHNDVRSMPGADPNKKKYVSGANLGGEIYADYFQWKSGEGGKGAVQLDGHVADSRVNKDGKALVKAEGEGKDGRYVVTFTRKLVGGEGDLPLAEGAVVPFGIAIHADQTIFRFHHVSLGYTLGLGVAADVKASKQ
ncbi:ethylbenzene dehydrogenase-related protein [Azospira restricta]|uniref:Cytochrome c-552/DMSO reductase-like haem-binding domain-containing protein n=1 Tax=Azospira restricta TaxID=404405 RepID=A0A974SPR2_9RHOO|nr:ethylbenzene dehydrogenase-related protein [Azospira restricta]QRJ64231.1 hypothetical protein IWH25_02410 [Azospira restricta]